MFSDQQVIESLGEYEVSVNANGGSVSVEKKVGDKWVITDRFFSDSSQRLNLGSTPTRFTPDGGATYEVKK